MNVRALIASIAFVGLGTAQAAPIKTASWAELVFHGTSGEFTISYKKTPNLLLTASDAEYLEGGWYYNANLGSQSPASIRKVMAERFGITPADSLAYVGGCDRGKICPAGSGGALLGSRAGLDGSFSVALAQAAHPTVTGFDFLAIHLGGGELFFHWDNPISEFRLTGPSGWNYSAISNYRSYLGPVSAVPLPAPVALFASGLLGLGLLRRFGRRR